MTFLKSRVFETPWVKKSVIRTALFLLAATWAFAVYACDPQAKIAESPPRDAWWLRIRFTPCDSQIYGIPVEKIDPSWRLASLMQLKHIPIPELHQSGLGGGRHFELSGDFNSDGRPDRPAVGVYETKDAKYGGFMLIVSRTDSGAWSPVFL